MNPQQESYITGFIIGACLGAGILALVFKLDIAVSAGAAIISILVTLFNFPTSVDTHAKRTEEEP